MANYDNEFSLKTKLLAGVTLFGLGLAAVTTIAIMFGSWYTVSQGELAVVTRFGKVVSVEEPGLHFKLPIVEDNTTMSIRTMKAHYSKMMTYSQDVQAAALSVSINYRIDPLKVQHIFVNYGAKEYVDKILSPRVAQTSKETFGKYSALSIPGQRGEIGSKLEVALSEALEGTGIIIDAVQIEDIDFSDVFEHAVESAMKAEAEKKEAAAQGAKLAERAKGEADSKVEAARGLKATADAEAYAITKKAQAMRENPQYAELIKAEAQRMAVEKWNGTLPTQMIPDSSLPMLNLK